ncbi:hypothetical protein IT398_00205 [Candidatus Nomurabacteria bacterium]|nr:hypothetical protein [Candidatus Nomurabacteria bacterium]
MKDFAYLVNTLITKVLNPLSYLFLAVAVAYFLMGVLKYVRQSGSDDDREEGRKMMIYGIVALFVMVSVWGLVNVLGGTFNLDNNSLPVPSLSDR